MRHSHQTRQADKGVRMRYLREEKDDKKMKPTLFHSIIRQFNEALKETQDDQAIWMGYECSAWWATNRVPAPGAHDGKILAPPLVTGNSTNAAVTAAAVVKQARHLNFCHWIFRADSTSGSNLA